MNKQEAKTLAKATFRGGFDETQFTRFISNLFEGYQPLSERALAGSYIKDAFRPFISRYRRIGKYIDAEGNKIDAIIVHLQKDSSLERARTMQRNFVADYLKTRDKAAALVAFLSPDPSDWRLSLVKFETTFQHDEEQGKLKMVNETTPAKRYSFLIGENEGKHTVTSRFLELLQSDVGPTLAELEAAFDIETVSKEFFEKYKELFLRMKEALDELVKKDAAIRIDFEAKEISTVNFAKKTMGQIVFLYFLQKKGWLGVKPNEAWGRGSKGFLRDLFDKPSNFGINFFNDIMQPLFYEALASDRRDNNDFYSKLDCRMPFLNGGLFESMQGDAWTRTHISLPDELFSNQNKTKEGDVGDGILDVFDRYNFTVNESEPLEKEVAVDPEMLGKVFENLLEIKDRKSKGAYYTPREIVHYMCQQCLIHYLETELRSSIAREDIEFLILNGSRIIENDRTYFEKQAQIKKGEIKSTEYKLLMPKALSALAKEIDTALANIKVCDPAVGSGAFPLGMLNEIIRARAALAVHKQEQEINYYELKKHTIIHSLYGVDLDSGAVEIAKLRLWLALVVEEKEPHPLPNLECKIMQGNSLISQYEGITLFDETILLKDEDSKSRETEKDEITKSITTLQSRYFEVHRSELEPALKQESLKKIEKSIEEQQKRQEALSDPSSLSSSEMSLFSSPQERKIAHENSLKLQQLIKEFIDTSHNKKTLKEKIDNLKWDLIEATLKAQSKAEKLNEIKALRKKYEQPFFLWQLEFLDVFRENGGFDVVIGNPPYVSYGLRGGQKISEEDKVIFKKSFPNSAEYKISMYAMFIDRAMQIVKDVEGVQSFIVPDSFLLGRYFFKVRTLILDRNQINEILLLDYKVFNNATVGKPVIYNFQRGPQKDPLKIGLIGSNSIISSRSFSVNLEKISTFSNERNRFYLYFSKEHRDIVHKLFSASTHQISDFLNFSSGLIARNGQKSIQSKSPQSGYKKGIISGSEFGRFWIKETGIYLSAIPEDIKSGLKSVKYDEPKMFLRQTGDAFFAHLDRQSLLALNNVHIGNFVNSAIGHECLVAFINSSLYTFAYQTLSLEKGRAMAQIDIDFIKLLPIKVPDRDIQFQMTKIVNSIYEVTSNAEWSSKSMPTEQAKLQSNLDDLIFDLYGLSEEERQLVQDAIK